MELEQLQNQLHKEFETYVKSGNNNCQFFIHDAYRVAIFNEVVDFFDSRDDEEWEDDWKDIVKDGLNDILNGVYDYYLDIDNPADINFFCYEGLVDILKGYFNKANRC